MEPNEQDRYTQAAMTAVLVDNDFHYMHLMSKGEDFDKSHNLAAEYYDKIEEDVDYLMELALEVGAPIYNFSVAGNIIPEYEPEDKQGYDYPTLISCLKDKIQYYTDVLRKLRISVTEDTSIQSKLDDMLRYWEKELFYKLERRGTSGTTIGNFVNTGLDEFVSKYFNKR